MQNPHDRPLQGQPSLDAFPHSRHEGGQPSLDGAALDLVRAATDEGDDAVVRTLLGALVALDLTSAATFWTASWGDVAPPRWIQRRGFGGATPAPDLAFAWMDDDAETSRAAAPGMEHGSVLTFRFGDRGALVAIRESFDRDGDRDRREGELETLVFLAETLLAGDGEISESRGPEQDSHGGVASPLPTTDRSGPNRRRAG